MKGLHHLHLRKRIHKDLEPFPARTAWLRLLDRVVLAVGIIGPLTTIPQILKIFILEDAAGVSVISWGTWMILDIPWIIYGIVHRERPIAVTYTLWLFMNAAVFVEAVIYGAGSF